MLRKVMTIAALFAVVAVAGNAQAAPIDSLNDETVDGGLNVLEDKDFEALLDKTTHLKKSIASVAKDDIFVGIFSIETVNGDGILAMGGTFTGILVAKVKAAPVGSIVEFVALSDAEYSSLQGTYAALPNRVHSSSAILVYQKTPETNFTTFPNGFLTTSTINAGFSSASTHSGAGTVVKTLELGFVGNTYAAAKINAVNPVLQFSLALNVTSNPLDIEMGGITTPWSGMFQVDGTTFLPQTNFHIGGFANTGGAGDFQFQTNADLKFLVPEPTSFTLLGLGALGLFGARLRRRNAA